MKIDTMTILLALAIMCSGFTLAMLLAWRMLLPMRALLFWGTGMGCYAAGLFLLNTRDILPDFFSMLMANLLLVFFYCCLWTGFTMYRGKRPEYRLMAGILALFISCYSWFVWVSPGISARTAIVRLSMMLLLVGAIAALHRHRTAPLTMMEKMMTGAMLLDLSFRLLLFSIQIVNMSYDLPLQKNMVTAMSALMSIIGMTATGLATVLLALERSETELIKTITEKEDQETVIKQNQERLEALLEISHYQAEDVQALLDFALAKVIAVTGSQFGYIYHYHEDTQEFVLNSWSKGVMPACAVADPQSLYHLEKTGIWGEAVRQRRGIMLNDFAAHNPLKKGYPEGHVHLSRFLTIPVGVLIWSAS